MNVVERGPAQGTIVPSGPPKPLAEAPAAGGARLRPLRSLLPYVDRYRGRALSDG